MTDADRALLARLRTTAREQFELDVLNGLEARRIAEERQERAHLESKAAMERWAEWIRYVAKAG